ncbi:MAG: 5-(carboxyamino)imidazole ribonucleotide synthase [Chloroflexi bacterium]|nr:5-(carboxyamino)imidazole ribonucleotide synthase [Chloroflexota bacterium]
MPDRPPTRDPRIAASGAGSHAEPHAGPPILPYPQRPLIVTASDPIWPVLAARVMEIVRADRPEIEIHHIGSTSVPGLLAKPILDLGVLADPSSIADIAEHARRLGFGAQTGMFPFPPTRPLLLGALSRDDGPPIPIHLHVMPTAGRFQHDLRRHLVFRDALRADPDLRQAYADLKRGIVRAGVGTGLSYSLNKTAFIRDVLAAHGEEDSPLAPGSTIGIIGGGQLGRMLALAARRLGYRIVVLDPDPACPAAAVAERVVVATYDDVDAAGELAASCDVATYELEHIAAAMVRRIDADRPIHPVEYALRMTQDRLAERRFLTAVGAPTAPWREVRTLEDLRRGAAELGYPLRLKVAIGGYDGRSQVRLAAEEDLGPRFAALAGSVQRDGLLLERELEFAAECSAIVARDARGRTVAYPLARNLHDDGILVESIAPAPPPVTPAIVAVAQELAGRLATELDLVGILTVELFVLHDGSLVVNELAPRVHNSGHWTIEGAVTSQFEQHIRALAGLPLGAPDATGIGATVNLLGTGRRRPARLAGLDRALADPAVHLHVYDKREVFERRKMGHLTVVAAHPDEAITRARTALAALHWEDEP